jgi:hypothetical protein
MLRSAVVPLLRLILRIMGPGDPWERFPRRVPLRAFGLGAIRPFPWYFEGESLVAVTSVDEICAWLLGCEYVRDQELFHEPDFWQHPRTFERLRCGDCEDHALWAWRKLVELGLDAELVSGQWAQTCDGSGGHVWIRFRESGQEYILEAVSRTRERMVRPFEEARVDYVPHTGVDREFRSYAYYRALRSIAARPAPRPGA